MLEQAQASSDADVVYLMDADGVTLAASNWNDRFSFVGADYGFRPYVRGAVSGEESTFYAVGATTGEPGYFVAVPVHAGLLAGRDRKRRSTSSSTVIGVLAAKLSLDALVDLWQTQPYRSLVTDDLGVVILSTDASLLYTPTSELDAATRAALGAERRYDLVPGDRLLLTGRPCIPAVCPDAISWSCRVHCRANPGVFTFSCRLPRWVCRPACSVVQSPVSV